MKTWMKRIDQVKFETMRKLKGPRKSRERGVNVGKSELRRWEKGGTKKRGSWSSQRAGGDSWANSWKSTRAFRVSDCSVGA